LASFGTEGKQGWPYTIAPRVLWPLLLLLLLLLLLRLLLQALKTLALSCRLPLMTRLLWLRRRVAGRHAQTRMKRLCC
jgi:nitric oxide reductase large subunit